MRYHAEDEGDQTIESENFNTIFYKWSHGHKYMFNLLHRVSQEDRDEEVQVCLKTGRLQYMACPTSPLQFAEEAAAKMYFDYFERLKEAGDVSIHSRFELDDFFAILNFPDDLRTPFFHSFHREVDIRAFKDLYSWMGEYAKNEFSTLTHLNRLQ